MSGRTGQIAIDNATLEANVALPENPSGVVLFAHGSGSGRQSPRNRLVASMLNDRGIATVLVDLLTLDEERFDLRTGALRFDVPLLAGRLSAATEWVLAAPDTSELPLGYFGASTGAAAALIAAVQHDETRAVVSRGGRPDLAADALPDVRAPTLLIVGERDPVVIELNRRALGVLRCEKELEIVPLASHLFEEPGALERIGELAGDWFLRWFYSS